jgi:hypothetical protein
MEARTQLALSTVFSYRLVNVRIVRIISNPYLFPQRIKSFKANGAALLMLVSSENEPLVNKSSQKRILKKIQPQRTKHHCTEYATEKAPQPGEITVCIPIVVGEFKLNPFEGQRYFLDFRW